MKGCAARFSLPKALPSAVRDHIVLLPQSSVPRSNTALMVHRSISLSYQVCLPPFFTMTLKKPVMILILRMVKLQLTEAVIISCSRALVSCGARMQHGPVLPHTTIAFPPTASCPAQNERTVEAQITQLQAGEGRAHRVGHTACKVSRWAFFFNWCIITIHSSGVLYAIHIHVHIPLGFAALFLGT